MLKPLWSCYTFGYTPGVCLQASGFSLERSECRQLLGEGCG